MTRQIEARERNLAILERIEGPIVSCSLVENFTHKELPLSDAIFVKEGILSLVSGTRLKERYLILFMNVLLICKSFKTKLILESGYSISELEIQNDGKNGTLLSKLKTISRKFKRHQKCY